ncbi:MAG: hypothetical protein CM15mV16_0380 [uncultured marine virus]|nr:MAG: hypothetical protein CM15mV16_0380 [uncultured marine virus]
MTEHMHQPICVQMKVIIIQRNNIELKNVLDSPYNFDRKEIQDATWEKHSYKNWKNHFQMQSIKL